MSYRIGYGYDVHRFTKGSEIWIGGIKIPHDKGILAHSDGDVLFMRFAMHCLVLQNCVISVINFLITSPEYKNIDSKILLEGIVSEKYRIRDSVLSILMPQLQLSVLN